MSVIFKKSAAIAVLLGGLSKEREISFKTGRAMAKALREKGYSNVSEIDVDQNIAHTLKEKRIDAAVIALHGRFGEDGCIQGVLEYLGIPYTGTGVLGSALAMDKVLSKKIFDAETIPTPAWTVTTRGTSLEEVKEQAEEIGIPIVCKPANEGSTIGLSIVKDEKEIENANRLALESDDRVLWEKYVPGDELTVGVLKGRALPIVEIVPKSGLFDYEAKYTKGKTEYFCPARVDKVIADQVQDFALKAFHALECETFGRVDVMWSENRPWVIEVNTIPGMTETSLLPKAAKAEGLSFEDLVEQLLQDARVKFKVGKKN